ncbi:MAG: pyruvate kinase [Bacteroidales bacterium]|nr:pyruvate kinase [Bacteroidales bacterium]
MDLQNNSRTKIIATIGPASESKNILQKMFEAGIDVCRLNFSHGTHEKHRQIIQNIRDVNKELGTNVAILADLQGPKIRIGEIKNDSVFLEDGSTVQLVTKPCIGDKNKIYLSYHTFAGDARPGETILVDDGKIKLEVVQSNQQDTVEVRVVHGGMLSSRKGVNLPNTKISLPSLTEKDLEDARFIINQDVDWIALSFVRSAEDIRKLRELIHKAGKDIGIVAKIEKPEALENIDAIIGQSDALMIARGDLGVEVSYDQVPYHQKIIVKKCIQQSKPVIIATQMLESMITNFRPTRAEASDVANAVFDGADCLMLSGETSVGKYPVETIQAMQRIIDFAERTEYEKKQYHMPEKDSSMYIADMVCYNASVMADVTDARAIITFTAKGNTAIKISSQRPATKIYAFTSNPDTIRKLSLVWGVETYYQKPYNRVNEAIQDSIDFLKANSLIKTGDVVVHLGSLPELQSDVINVMKVDTIE